MKTIQKLCHSNSGFSLPELMMAAAIMGVLAMGFMKLTQNGVEGGKRVEAGAQVTELKNEILGTMSNRDACFQTFFTATDFTDVVGGGTKTITTIKDKGNNIRFSSSKIYPGGVTLDKISVKDYDATNQTAGLFLDFSYKLNSAVVMQKTRRFNLQLELTGNTLKSCVALAGVQNIDLKQLCDGVIGFNGVGASYFTAGECQFAQASCEKSGGVWDATLEKCSLGSEQKFNVRKAACDSDRGYFMKVVQGWSFNIEGLTSSSMCTVADITANNKCFCRTSFQARKWHTPPAPTEPDSTGYQAKRIVLAAYKFNVISPIITIANPFPDGDTRPRYVKMSTQVHVDNVSPDGLPKWFTISIGCYRESRAAYRAQQDYFPLNSSTDYTSAFGVGGYKLQTDDFKPTLANGTQVGNSSAAAGATQVSRGDFIFYSGGGIYQPGDKCAVILYTHNGGAEALVGSVMTTSDHSTVETDYGYGPSSWPTANGF